MGIFTCAKRQTIWFNLHPLIRGTNSFTKIFNINYISLRVFPILVPEQVLRKGSPNW